MHGHKSIYHMHRTKDCPQNKKFLSEKESKRKLHILSAQSNVRCLLHIQINEFSLQVSRLSFPFAQGTKCLACLYVNSLPNTSLHVWSEMVAMMSEYPWDGDEDWRGIWKRGADVARVEDWLSSINDVTWLLPYCVAENDERGGYFRKLFIVSFRVVSNIYCRPFRKRDRASLFRRPESRNDPSFRSIIFQIVRSDSLEGNIISGSASSIRFTGAEG